MNTFKVKINFAKHFVIKYVQAANESDACWEAKDEASKFKGVTSFDLMYA